MSPDSQETNESGDVIRDNVVTATEPANTRCDRLKIRVTSATYTCKCGDAGSGASKTVLPCCCPQMHMSVGERNYT